MGTVFNKNGGRGVKDNILFLYASTDRAIMYIVKDGIEYFYNRVASNLSGLPDFVKSVNYASMTNYSVTLKAGTYFVAVMKNTAMSVHWEKKVYAQDTVVSTGGTHSFIIVKKIS